MTVSELGRFISGEAGKVIAGQEDVLEQIMVSFLSRGHVLLEGPPGIAKTLIVRTVATVLDCDFKRVQFTPDLMPSDVTGTFVFDSRTADFHLKKGPVFTNFLLADEINRTPPKTQSALLQAMEERNVTIDGSEPALEGIFFVAGTQNPIEYEGTYPLPEAQLDRFLMKVMVGYPGEAEELEVLQRAHSGFDPHDLKASGISALPDTQAVTDAWKEIEAVKIDQEVMRYAVSVTRATRTAYQVILGASPRASVALLKCSKSIAALRGRDYVTPDDIKSLAPPVLRHRLILTPESLIEGSSVDEIIASVLASVPVPR